MAVARAGALLALAALGAGVVLADTPTGPCRPTPAHRSAPAGAGRGELSSAAFRAVVDMPTFMEHVLEPAAMIVWRTNGFVNDADGDHDLSPKGDADWEAVVSGAATLVEASNALLIPQRVRDAAWTGYVERLASMAERAYEAAERRDLAAISAVSDGLDEACSACHVRYGVQ